MGTVEDVADGVVEDRMLSRWVIYVWTPGQAPKNRATDRFLSGTAGVNMAMAMTSVEPDRFEAATAAYRRELVAHCYGMTGSAYEVRIWCRRPTFGPGGRLTVSRGAPR